jgi:hypothetical protein
MAPPRCAPLGFPSNPVEDATLAQSVSGASPVTFISEDVSKPNAGTQYQIPLPLISYAAGTAYNTTATPPTGPVVLTGWPQFAGLTHSDQLLAQAVVQNLINGGVLALSS